MHRCRRQRHWRRHLPFGIPLVDLEWTNSSKQNERNVSDTGLFPKLANLKKKHQFWSSMDRRNFFKKMGGFFHELDLRSMLMQNSAISMEKEINAFSWGILNLGMACFVGIFISYISVVDSSSAKYLKREPHFEWTPKDPGESEKRHRLPRHKKNKQGTISQPAPPTSFPFLGKIHSFNPHFSDKRLKFLGDILILSHIDPC